MKRYEREKTIKFISNIFWMLFDKVFLVVFNFFVSVIIANHYGASIYGVFQYSVSVVAILEAILGFVDASVVKKYLLNYNADELIWNVTLIRLFLSIIMFVVGIVYLCIFRRYVDDVLVYLILLINSGIVGIRFGMQVRFEYLVMAKRIVIANDISIVIGGVLQIIAITRNMGIVSLAVITMITSYSKVF